MDGVDVVVGVVVLVGVIDGVVVGVGVAVVVGVMDGVRVIVGVIDGVTVGVTVGVGETDTMGAHKIYLERFTANVLLGTGSETAGNVPAPSYTLKYPSGQFVAGAYCDPGGPIWATSAYATLEVVPNTTSATLELSAYELVNGMPNG